MKILVTDQSGAEHELEGLDGWRTMEVIRDWGLNIKAECGGACSCATCHVYVDEPWFSQLPPPSDDEGPALFHSRQEAELAAELPDPAQRRSRRHEGHAGRKRPQGPLIETSAGG
jgi:ferredoxin